MPLPSVTYPAFISYAGLDDEGNNYWIESFIGELRRVLNCSPELRRKLKKRQIDMPVQLYDYKSEMKSKVAGRFTPDLEKAIASSAVMIVVVGGNYLESAICMRELEFFKQIFGDEGYDSRLVIVAMSETYLEELKELGQHTGLLPYDDQRYIQCWRDDNPNKPIPIYAGSGFRPGIKSEVFDEKITSIANSVIFRFLECLESPQNGIVSQSRHDIHIYIEESPDGERANASDKRTNSIWHPIASKIKSNWDAVISNKPNAQHFNLNCKPLRMEELPCKGDKFLPDADGVILIWDSKDEPALTAQIDTVEAGLPQNRLPPAMVAYLTPPRPALAPCMPYKRWNVLRFENQLEKKVIDVAQEDSPYLVGFLQEILIQKLQAPSQ